MEISKNQELLLDINKFICQLDAYLSLLMATIEFRLVPPVFKENDQPIKICKARNLLVEFQTKLGFSSQDYAMNLSSTSVIFGANGSGKSIHLKTLGGIAYLA